MPHLSNTILESAKDTDFELDIRIILSNNQTDEGPDTFSLFGQTCDTTTVVTTRCIECI